MTYDNTTEKPFDIFVRGSSLNLLGAHCYAFVKIWVRERGRVTYTDGGEGKKWGYKTEVNKQKQIEAITGKAMIFFSSSN